MGAPTGSVFISYRRGDAPFAAHAIHGQLSRRFQEDRIFMDVCREGGVPAGADFAEVIVRQIERCDVLLVLIGPNWSQVTDDQDRRRIDTPDDWVRLEIATALKANKRVIPVLVGDATMPTKASLPDELSGLARRNALRLSHENFEVECGHLVRQVELALIQADGDKYARRFERPVKNRD